MVLRGYDTGLATAYEVERALSRDAVRRSARVTRPGLPRPHRAPAAAVGIRLGRRQALGRRPLYATLEDVVLAVAPPRSGKTAWLGGAVIDAPGAVVATSTKTDLYEYTGLLRALRGPVHVFNPEGLGAIPSTF